MVQSLNGNAVQIPEPSRGTCLAASGMRGHKAVSAEDVRCPPSRTEELAHAGAHL